MLTSDIDSYYSPVQVTNVLEDSLGSSRPMAVLDSNCGGGALLDVVERAHPKISCFGIDRDERAIRSLKDRRPHWNLVQGDSLCGKTWVRLNLHSTEIDLAVLNPPFSMGTVKGLEIAFRGIQIRGSLAMAHVLGTIQNSNPKKILAVLPASLLASELDGRGRSLIEFEYDVEPIAAFKNSIFKGARASSVLLRLSRRKGTVASIVKSSSGFVNAQTRCVRGGLPVFQASSKVTGLPFVHSTDLGAVARGRVMKLRTVEPILRGITSGHAILLPRVGLPLLQHLCPVNLPLVQLSDCVISLEFDAKAKAEKASSIISEDFESLLSLYVGTGARYVTMRRLSGWLGARGL